MKTFTRFLALLILVLTASNILFAKPAEEFCNMDSLPPIYYKRGAVTLDLVARNKLDSMTLVINEHPLCKISVTGYGSASEEDQQVSWDKVASVIKYLISKGIDKERFVFRYGEEGNSAVVQLAGGTDDGPFWVPAPHPCMSHKLPPKKRCKH